MLYSGHTLACAKWTKAQSSLAISSSMGIELQASSEIWFVKLFVAIKHYKVRVQARYCVCSPCIHLALCIRCCFRQCFGSIQALPEGLVKSFEQPAKAHAKLALARRSCLLSMHTTSQLHTHMFWKPETHTWQRPLTRVCASSCQQLCAPWSHIGHAALLRDAEQQVSRDFVEQEG